MADVRAQDVKSLRDATGAGMMDAKRALVEANGDQEAAAQALREKGLAKAAARSERDNTEGAIGMAVTGDRAAMIHLKCETDFSAKSDGFLTAVDDLAASVLGEGLAVVEKKVSLLDDLRLSIKENVEIGEVFLIEASDGNSIDTYLHRQDGRGVNGVIIEASGVDQEILHQIALHVAFARPTALTREDIPVAAVETEREALLEITKAEGKPEQAWEKIVEGRLSSWFKETVLLEQGLHGDKISVQETIGDGEVVRFVQSYLGD